MRQGSWARAGKGKDAVARTTDDDVHGHDGDRSPMEVNAVEDETTSELEPFWQDEEMAASHVMAEMARVQDILHVIGSRWIEDALQILHKMMCKMVEVHRKGKGTVQQSPGKGKAEVQQAPVIRDYDLAAASREMITNISRLQHLMMKVDQLYVDDAKDILETLLRKMSKVQHKGKGKVQQSPGKGKGRAGRIFGKGKVKGKGPNVARFGKGKSAECSASSSLYKRHVRKRNPWRWIYMP